MSGLRLGDLILDPRKAVYIPSLRVVVCSGLHEALGVGISGGLRDVLKNVDSVIADYKPESLIVVGHFGEESALAGISRRWGKKTRVQLVAKAPPPEARALAEALGCEVHQDLHWGRYRFVEEHHESESVDLQQLTLVGSPHYSVRVGNRPFGGMKLTVFLKGLGRLILPSLSPSALGNSIFRKDLERFDVFAVGHQRVLPMGKVADIKPLVGITRSLPLDKSTLNRRRRSLTESSLD